MISIGLRLGLRNYEVIRVLPRINEDYDIFQHAFRFDCGSVYNLKDSGGISQKYLKVEY
jgi:hypothetical protein